MIPGYEEADRLRALRSTADEWFDGQSSAMYRFATGKPFNPRRLLSEAQTAFNLCVTRPQVEKPRLQALIDHARGLVDRQVLAQRLEAIASDAKALGLDLDDVLELVRAGWRVETRPLTPQMARLIADAKAAGLVVEDTAGGCRIYHRDDAAEAVGQYGLGVDIALSDTGGFVDATRIDVDLSITTTIRTLKEVRKLLLG